VQTLEKKTEFTHLCQYAEFSFADWVNHYRTYTHEIPDANVLVGYVSNPLVRGAISAFTLFPDTNLDLFHLFEMYTPIEHAWNKDWQVIGADLYLALKNTGLLEIIYARPPAEGDAIRTSESR